MEIRSIVPDIDQFVGSRISVAPQDWNRASGVGHPCERKLAYARLNWQDKAPHDVGLQYIFNEGNIQEREVVKLLLNAGFEFAESQRTVQWEHIKTRGHIDGKIQIDGEWYPIEIKSCSPFVFPKLKDLNSIKNAKEIYLRGYYDQMQIYLLLTDSTEGVFLFKNKTSGRLKQINVPLDYDYAETLIKKLKRVNKHVEAKTYPERIDDRTICQKCDFRHICLPDEESDMVQIMDNDKFYGLLEQREELKEFATEYKIADEKVKEVLSTTSDGDYLYKDINVRIKTHQKAFYKVPPEIKNKYREEVSQTRITINKVGE